MDYISTLLSKQPQKEKNVLSPFKYKLNKNSINQPNDFPMKRRLRLSLITFVAILISISGFASNNPVKPEVIKYTFQLHKPITETYREGFLKMPGVISYKIADDGSCEIYIKPQLDILVITEAITRAGYKVDQIHEYTMTYKEYENIFYGTSAQDEKTYAFSKKWGKGGEFEGFRPEQEIVSKRGRNAKHFKKADGSYVAQIGGVYHYKNERGNWADVDYNIEPTNTNGFKYANETNEYKSYFPEGVGNKGVVLKNGNSQINWWVNPTINIQDESTQVTALSTKAANIATATIENKVIYTLAEGIEEHFTVIGGGIEDDILLTNQAVFNNCKTTDNILFTQTIPLSNDYKLYSDGKLVKNNTALESFTIKQNGNETGFVFNPLIVFDAKISKDEALTIINWDNNKEMPAKLAALKNSAMLAKYVIVFKNGAIELSIKVPAQWLKDNNRTYPVVVDPTVTIGTGTSTSYLYPLNIDYDYARCQLIYTKADINISTAATITAIAFNTSTTGNVDELKNSQLWMNHTTAASFATATWTTPSNLVYGPATYTTTTGAGWKTITLTTPFSYNNTDNLIISYKHADDTYESSYNSYYYTTTTTYQNVYGYLDGGEPTTFYRTYSRPNIQITYTEIPNYNDNCISATTLTPAIGSTCNATAGDVATATASTPTSVCSGTADDDVWYKFTATATAHNVTVAGSTSFDAVVQVLSGTCTGGLTNIICTDATTTGETEIVALSGLTVGSTYYVRVYHYGATMPATTTFNICVTTPGLPSCATYTSPLNGAVVVPITPSLAWLPVNDAVSYDVYLGTMNPPTTLVANIQNTSYTSTALTSNTVYYWKIVPKNAVGDAIGCSVWNFKTINTTSGCQNAKPFCADAATGFPPFAAATTGTAESGPNYGCLSTVPKPSWYYLKVGASGDINMTITSTAGDVDFICWGPFTQSTAPCVGSGTGPTGGLTGTPHIGSSWPNNTAGFTWYTGYDNGNIVDCSYDAAATEACHIIGAVAGEYYMVLITNFAGVTGTITFNQTSGTGTTDCSIAAINPTSNANPICMGSTLYLTASSINQATYQWSSNTTPIFTSTIQNPSIPSVTAANEGDYYVRVTVNGIVSSWETLHVAVNPAPTIALSPIANVCKGATSFTLPYTATSSSPTTYTITPNAAALTAGFTAQYNKPLTAGSISVVIPTAVVAGTYTFGLTVKNENGCQSTSQNFTVIINPLPTVTGFNVTGGGSICVGGSVAVNLTGSQTGVNYQFLLDGVNTGTPIAGTGNLITGSYSNAGTYTVVATNTTTGCSTAATTGFGSALVVVNPDPAITVQPLAPSAICVGGTLSALTLTATGGTPSLDYQWYSNTAPSTTTPAPTLIGGATTNSYTPLTSTAGTKYYFCSVTASGSGCGAVVSDFIPVTIETSPAITASPISPSPVCVGGTLSALSVTATGGAPSPTYQWRLNGSNILGETATTYTPPTTTAGTFIYSCVVSATGSGCGSATSNNATVTVVADPAITTQPTTPVTTCQGEIISALNVVASGGTPSLAYQWYLNGTSLAPAGQTSSYTPPTTAAGTSNYTCVVSASGSGCGTATSTASAVTINPLPTIVSVSKVDVLVCNQLTGQITINATGAATLTYSIDNGATWAASNIFNNLAAGNYNVAVKNGFGCISYYSSTVVIAAGGAPAPPTAGTSAVYCQGQTAVNLTATAGNATGTLIWYYGTETTPLTGTTSINPNSKLVVGTNNFYVTETVGGCTSNSTLVTITVNPKPVASISTINPVCSNSAAFTLTQGIPTGGTYTGTGVSAGVFNPVTAGIGTHDITYIYIDANGCRDTANRNISVTSLPSITGAVTTNVSCYNGSDGSYSYNTTGGTPPYNYTWNTTPNILVEDLTGRPSGTYIVTISDVNSCKAYQTVTISQPTLIVNTLVPNNALCFVGNTGGVNLTVTGGTQFTVPSDPYTYAWSNLVTTEDISNVPSGTYTVTVTDAKGCKMISSATVVQPSSAISSTIVGTNLSCFQAEDGTISIAPTGGTPSSIGSGYTYHWSDNSSLEDRTNLPAGSYSVTITDANACTLVKYVTITQPALLQTSIVGTNLNCFGDNSGAANLTITGGTSPYGKSWSNGGSYTAYTEDISALAAGTYCVTVTDDKGCKANQCVTITQPDALTISSTVVSSNCGNSDGSATVTVGGGVPGYTYNWAGHPTAITATLGSIGAGQYPVTVTDTHSCSITSNPTIVDLGAATISISTTGANLCFGNALVDATVSVNLGGTPPFDYVWTKAGSPVGSTATITGLGAGTYIVTVIDDVNCATSTSVVITEPSQLTGSIVNTIPVRCSGDVNGQATAVGGSGTPTYTYLWDNASTAQTPGNLAVGPHIVTITDANGCKVTANCVIATPAVLNIIESSHADLKCYGIDSGYVALTGTGGNPFSALPNYSFVWSDGIPGEIRNNLAEGTYTVTATDSLGCTSTRIITMYEPTDIVLTGTTDSAYCNLANGIATVIVTGGTTGTPPVYDYEWNNSAGTSATATGLIEGSYIVTVTDDNGCKKTRPFSIYNIPKGTMNITATEILCYGNLGSITASITSGYAPYTFTWFDGPFILTNPTSTHADLGAGTYTVTIVDNRGCTSTKSITTTQPTQLTGVVNNIVNEPCSGDAKGTATAVGSNATPGYTYLWDNGDAIQTADSLLAGQHFVTITDSKGCSIVTSGTVNQPAPLVISETTHTDLTCFGVNLGAVTVSGSGGTPTYTFAWTGLPIGTSQDSLAQGTYTVTMTDANGCKTQKDVVITTPTEIILSGIADSAKCSLPNGSATVTATGGVTPYSYLWSPSSIAAATASDLAEGTYIVTVTDGNGCKKTRTFIVGNIHEGTVSSTSTNIKCYGEQNGTATVTMTGGNAPFTYLWTGSGSTTNVNDSLAAGTYFCTVIDDEGCVTTTSSIIIEKPTQIVITTEKTTNKCFGDANATATASATGGTGSFGYAWSQGSTGATALSLATGNYVVTATDENGCKSTSSITILGPSAPLAANIISKNIDCFGGKDGSIQSLPTGGTPQYAHLWSTGSTDQIINVSAGTYTLTLTDASGSACPPVIETVIITEGPQMIIVLDPSNLHSPSCKDRSNGSIEVSAQGGTGFLNYSWPMVINGDTTILGTSNILDSISGGTYTVIITDEKGCSKTMPIQLAGSNEECLVIPNVFTPNGIGEKANETWGIQGIDLYSNIDIQIYNKWGQLIFNFTGTGIEYLDASKQWDGTYNGKDCAIGPYLYIIDLKTNSKPSTGTVTIVR